MRNTLDKLVSLFCIIVFITFLANHGHIDFSAIDWIRKTSVEAIQSDEGQATIKETTEISKNVFLDILHAIDRLFGGDKEDTTEEQPS